MGLYWMSVRAYDPALGRFLSRDPLGRVPLFFADQPYVYGGNNPLTYVDPSGQMTIPDGGGQSLYDPYRYPVNKYPLSPNVSLAWYTYHWQTHLPRWRMLTLAGLLIKRQNDRGGPGRNPKFRYPYPTFGGAVITFSPTLGEGEEEETIGPLGSSGPALHAEQGSINRASTLISEWVDQRGRAAINAVINVHLITTLPPCGTMDGNCQFKFNSGTWMAQLLNAAGEVLPGAYTGSDGISVFLWVWYIKPSDANPRSGSVIELWRVQYARLRGPTYL
jgi:hypothetical protein